MWKNNESDHITPARGFLTPPPKWRSPASENNQRWPAHSQSAKPDLFHVIHKVPSGDSPYVRAKHVQLIDKDPSKAISLFWAAINSGDRVDSALKDMAVVMKQLNRADEAIEAIKSFRHLCPPDSQESIDNILIELYKRSGRIKEEIELLELKLKNIEEGLAFGGRKTKIARSQGKKVHITVEKEYSRLLGNLAWSHMQLKNFKCAEEYYRKALSLEPDRNKQSNLAICLMHMNKITEAKFLIQSIKASDRRQMDESCTRSFERATQMLAELETHGTLNSKEHEEGIFPAAGTPIFTQPRRFSCSLSDGNRFAKDTNACSRRLSFEQTRNNENCNFNRLHSSWRSGANMKSESSLQPIHNFSENDGSDIAVVNNTSARKFSEKLESTSLQASDLSACKNKTTWADMVEEDELGFQFYETPRKFSDGNENVDSNIMNSLSQSTESLCLSGGYHTQPGRAAVKRSLYFDQNVREEICSSNFRGKEFKFGSLSSLPPIGDIANQTPPVNFRGEEFKFGSLSSLPPIGDIANQTPPVKLMRRNRLQVFQDITPESPKA